MEDYIFYSVGAVLKVSAYFQFHYGNIYMMFGETSSNFRFDIFHNSICVVPSKVYAG